MLALALRSIPVRAQISPGELSSPHSHLEGLDKCTGCHTLGRTLSNEKCLRCHTEIRARLTRQSIQARAERRRLREDVDARVKALEDDLGEMALFVRTLYRVLVEKGSIDRAAFLEAMKAVDASDGAADGKYTGPTDTP